MALLSDREAFDRMALRRAEAAIQSEISPLTVGEAAAACGLPCVSEADLLRLIRVCHTWGIRTNCDTEPFWAAARGEG